MLKPEAYESRASYRVHDKLFLRRIYWLLLKFYTFTAIFRNVRFSREPECEDVELGLSRFIFSWDHEMRAFMRNPQILPALYGKTAHLSI